MKGRDKHMRRLKALAEPRGPVNQALRVIAEKIEADAHQSIMAGSVSGKGHIASAPGEAPNNEFGDLARGLVSETFPSESRAEVRAEAVHSEPLEFGTSKMEARPFMRLARDKNKAFGKAVLEKQMKEFVKKSGR